MGANVIGVDQNAPSAPLGSFIRGDLSSAKGINDVVKQLPNRVDSLLAVAGLSGTQGAEKTLAVNFYGLRHLAEKMALAHKIREGGSIASVASFAGYGWRSELERTKKLMAVEGFPDAKKLAELG